MREKKPALRRLPYGQAQNPLSETSICKSIMHGVLVPRRRRKREEVEEAWSFAAEKRRDVDAFWECLVDPHKVTRLPYPGVSYPGRRPGYSFNFIGNPNVQKVRDAWNRQNEYTRKFYVVGAKGIGKSSVMRAFAWYVYVLEPENLKLVCVWNMTYARGAFFEYVKEALYFLYFRDKDALSKIQDMLCLSDVQAFLRSREEKGEVIVFLLDEAQAVDIVHWDKRPRNDDDGSLEATRSWMIQLFRGRPVIWVLSPAAEKVVEFEEKVMDDTCVIHLNTGFVGDDAMDGFMSRAILGLLIEKRGRDISYYAAKHPLLLLTLEECCQTVAAAKMNTEPKNVQREDAANLFEEDEDWEDVINAFIDHEYIASMQVDIDRHLKLGEGETYHTVEKMISCDPRYALSKNQFCSPYIERMYIEAFRAKERAASVNDCSPWVAYGEMLLSQPFINWSELGWLCERLYGDVVSRLGIDIGAKLSIGKLTLKRIRKAPSVEPELVPGHGVLYLPVTFSFGHVDAIIIYRGVDGKLHFIGLKITTSLKQHMHSENEFMSYEVLKEWNVLDGVWNLHYVFVCLTETEWSEEKKENLTRLRRDVVVGIVAHSLHVISFETALGNRTGKSTLEVLKKMTQLREAKLAPPPPKEDGALPLAKLKRRELDEIARDVMIDPKVYKKKHDLVAALRLKSIKSSNE